MLDMLAAIAIGGVAFVIGRRGFVRRLQRVEQDVETGRGELQRRMDELFSVQELSYMLADTMSVGRIADRVADYVLRFTRSEGAVVVLLRDAPRRLGVVGASGTLETLRDAVSDLGETSVAALAVTNERLETASGSLEHPIKVLGDHMTHGLAAAIPLQAHGEILGAMVVVRNGTRPLEDMDFRLLANAATHTALALGNARFVELIRSGKDQWESTFDAITDSIAVVDDAGCIRRGNRSLADLLAKPVIDVVGHELAPLLATDRTAIDGVIAAARDAQPQTHVARSDKLDRVLTVTAASMGDEQDWVVVLIEDVTEQTALEEAVIQSEKMAAVGQLVSGVAHELNNPLTSISGLTEFLLQQPYIEDRGREHLRVVRDQADRAAAIVRNLLTFARQGSPGSEDVDLNEVVERTAALTQYEMTLREISFTVDLDPNLPAVVGDRFQLQQVVLNLVTNAIQALGANPAGHSRNIAVRTSHANGKVILDVTDTGPGIPASARARIFEPFFTTKNPGEGTGLGLSIIYGIVQAHGGDIAVPALTDSGGRFVVSLPARPIPRDTEAPATALQTPARSASTGSVLLVDRDEAVRQMIHLVFSHVGHEVVIANADDAPDALTGDRDYGVIVADPRISIDGGESFADWLRRTRPDLLDRTIFLTADVREETMVWLNGLGCQFFHKPFNVQELKKAADQILRRQIAE